MHAHDTTTVLFDREDVNERSRLAPATHRFVALTPSASACAGECGLDLETSRVQLSDLDQGRCVVAGRRALREVDDSQVLSKLAPSQRLMVRQSLWLIAFLEHRLRRSLRQGPWLVRDKAGMWKMAKNYHTLLQILLPRMWEHGLAHSVRGVRPPLPSVYRWLMGAALWLTDRRDRLKVAAVTPKLRSGWGAVVRAAGADLVVIQPTTGLWQDYRQLPWRASTASILRVSPLRDDDSRVLQVVEALRAFGETLKDPHLEFAWALYVPYVAKIVPSMLALSEESGALLKSMGIRAVLGFEANSWLASALNDAAGRAGIQRVVLNHNSHPPTGSAAADSVLATLFEHRTFNPLVDKAGIWSPAAMKWRDTCTTSAGKNVQCQPVKLDYPTSVDRDHKTRPFRVLHAGNYQNWSDFFPWIAETSGEYLAGMERLAKAAQVLDDVELVFRVRPKREVDAQALAARLPTQANASVCDTSQDFLDQLADCDLLVCHFSTTVEQALQMGKPVLLWGNTQRYRQFAGRETLPDAQSRSAVYAVRHEQDLPAMLAAIRDAHHGRPLTQEEAAPYRHPPGTPSLSEWVGALLNPTGKS